MNRRVRPIYDALDARNYKLSLKLCTAALQKSADSSLIKALKAGNVAFADVISGPLPGSGLRTETNTVDLTVADALEVFATQSATDVCRFVIARVDGVISALITSLKTRGGDLRARRSYMETLGNLGERGKQYRAERRARRRRMQGKWADSSEAAKDASVVELLGPAAAAASCSVVHCCCVISVSVFLYSVFVLSVKFFALI